MKNLRLYCLLGIALLVLADMHVALAQVSASISGRVEDPSGAAIPDAAVIVTNRETGATRNVATDPAGNYRALSLPVGQYEVAAERTGFKKQVRTGITLVVGQEAVVNLRLDVGEVQQSVTVMAEAPIVNTTTASTSGLVGERQVKDLPLNGRSFDNLITLNPGTSGMASAMKQTGTSLEPGNQFNISGRRGTDNLFFLNGIEYTGASQYNSTPGGASGQLLGIDAVREFNVQAHTYGAEYGKRSGGQISIVTMSGGNQLHGTVFEFLRNSALDARNFFDAAKPQFMRHDFGGSAGGPIQKDKTFIFGNYEGYRQSLTSTNVAFVPDLDARKGLLPAGVGGALVNVGLAPGMAPYFALWPLPNGPLLGGGIAESFNPANNPIREDFGTVRLDRAFSERDWLSSAYTVDDGISTTPAADPLAGTVLKLRAQVWSLEETHTFAPTIINTARAGFSRASYVLDKGPLIPLPASLSMIAGQPMGQVTVGGGTGNGSSALSVFGNGTAEVPDTKNLFTYTDAVQIIKGKNLISLGAWFQRVQLNTVNGTASMAGTVSFADLTSFLQGKAATFQGSGRLIGVGFRQWEGAWYGQDTIKVLPNLTVNLGLRHEWTNGWNVHPAVPVNYLIGPDGVMLTDPVIGNSVFTENNAKRLLSPRIGLAWDPFGKGKTSIHAGFGTYYSLIDDLSFGIPQSSSFQLSNFQFPIQIVPGAALPAGGVPRPYNVTPSDARTATVQEWSLLIEQQLTASTALAAGYVGSHGYHFLGQADVNPARSVICAVSLGNCPAGLSDGTKYYPVGSQRLNPKLGSTNTYLMFGNTSYNSLQLDLRQRLAKGLTFRANYSFSKALDNGSTTAGAFFSNCQGYLLDSQNPRQDYGLSCYDIAQRFTFNGSYELPIGEGKALLGGSSGAAGKLAGGWRLNGIVSVQNGLPFTLVTGANTSRNGLNTPSDRPSLNPNFSGPVILGTPNRWFDPNAFILPPAGTYGNVGRNTLRAPGLCNVDVSLFKDTRLRERVNLQFRAEFFNLLNHANFGIPSRSLFTSSGSHVGSAGVITNTLTTSRQIQFGAKLIF